ncbi:N-acetylmuramoyl-L-alanine amidase [Clostridium tagluense]|uniref:N-acetylmuramoyl-L-alanine amidase n=1 Tax=Clostridium tagluense TaxID=360422 RepID=A0A401UQK6_9CLOT|nr:N-acetylmuramoyl-L-alanine amidase [Clostridium tagluense]GCD11842.1 N-acetylmuramoyl-L-alanine amidase [Clostridium tagluense]
MKYGIDIGHNCPPVDTGAVGIRKEDELNKQVGDRVIEKLKALKYEVVDCTPSFASNLGNSLYKRVNKANEEKVDVYVSIHFNSGGGRGTEVFAISKEGKDIAKRVVDAIATLDYVNRGVKDGSWLYVLKNTKMPAILVEGGFVDSKEDMQRFNAEKTANAIVKGLTGSTVNEKDSENGDAKPSVDIALLKMQNGLNILNILDYTGKKLNEDGIMGEKTISSVKRFQGIVGLEINGINDLKTNVALANILSKPLLKFGNNNIVANRYIQWRLNIIIDGIFGNDTEKAVLKYQTIKKINVDGIVGIITWNGLIV